jgi:uncharacterized membrane protein
MSDNERQEILDDYENMYDNYQDLGMTDDQIVEKLGEPSTIIPALTEGYRKINDAAEVQARHGKWIAISPFVAVVIFFVSGLQFELWEYAWMAFLIIPVMAIALTAGKDKYIALSPFVAVVVFFILGFEYQWWHPAWLVFLVIPVVAITQSKPTMSWLEYLSAISIFALIPIYVLYFGARGLWDPGWLILLGTPAIAVLNERKFLRILLWEVLIFGGAAGYLWLREIWGWEESLLAFAPLIAYAILQDQSGLWRMSRPFRYLTLGTGAIYALVGFVFDGWVYGWIVFLAIPMYAIWTETDGSERTIALTPFIATILFFLIGWLLGGWVYAWLVFLIIPVVAIVKGS